MTTTDNGGRVTRPETQPSSYKGTSSDNSDDLPPIALSRAVLLAAAVHDEGPRQVAAIVRPLTRQDLAEVAVCLAAMVPVDQTPTQLLAWNDEPDPAIALAAGTVEDATGLEPCGTHAAFNRHKLRGEQPCDACVVGERRYQARRPPRRRTTPPPSREEAMP